MDRDQTSCSECSSIASTTNTIRSSERSLYQFLGPNDPLLNNCWEKLMSQRLGDFDFFNSKFFPNLNEAFTKLEQLKQIKCTTYIISNTNVELTTKDKELMNNNKNDDDGKSIDELSYTEQFKRVYGDSLLSEFGQQQQPYLIFDEPIDKQLKRLNQMLESNQSKDLNKKLVLNEKIEQLLTVPPIRISKRQQKKLNAEKHQSALTQWFGMPIVKEISKEQEKDLMALKMRRIWNPKHFYKKSSQVFGSASGAIDTSKYFQIGTIQDQHTDFYNNRLKKRDRKRTIVDELMQDAELRAYNKRKLQYAMNKNSRLKILMRRAKMKRAKKRMQERRKKTPQMIEKTTKLFKTYEL